MSSTKKRIAYIDAMRGVTMLLVVYHHVILYGYEADHLSSDIASFNELVFERHDTLYQIITS